MVLGPVEHHGGQQRVPGRSGDVLPGAEGRRVLLLAELPKCTVPERDSARGVGCDRLELSLIHI